MSEIQSAVEQASSNSHFKPAVAERRWFSLVTVSTEHADTIEGNWLQDHFGTMETARERAKATSDVNSGARIAVVEQLTGPVPGLSYHRFLTPQALVGKPRT